LLVVGFGWAVVLVDRLGEHAPGQGVDIPLVAGDQEVEEVTDRPCLLLYRAPSPMQLLALVGKETVRVGRLCGPDWTPQELDELEQDGSVVAHRAVAETRADRCQQILINKLLFVVLELLCRSQCAGSTERPHDRQCHWCLPGWRNLTMFRRSRRLVTNPEGLSRYNLEAVPGTGAAWRVSVNDFGRNERQEVPASNPAELAGYAADSDEPDGEQSYVDLGWANDTTAGEPQQMADTDEFGSLGSDDQIDLDAA
jgi:hypothetical protein